jgi:hypothetical protein
VSGRKLLCATHGSHPWRGDVVCALDVGGCGRVYQTRDDSLPLFAPYDCVCGAALMPTPPRRADGSGPRVRTKGRKHTARAICDACFEERKAGPS